MQIQEQGSSQVLKKNRRIYLTNLRCCRQQTKQRRNRTKYINNTGDLEKSEENQRLCVVYIALFANADVAVSSRSKQNSFITERVIWSPWILRRKDVIFLFFYSFIWLWLDSISKNICVPVIPPVRPVFSSAISISNNTLISVANDQHLSNSTSFNDCVLQKKHYILVVLICAQRCAYFKGKKNLLENKNIQFSQLLFRRN